LPHGVPARAPGSFGLSAFVTERDAIRLLADPSPAGLRAFHMAGMTIAEPLGRSRSPR